MKKLFLVFAFVSVAALVACNSNTTVEEPVADETEVVEEPAVEEPAAEETTEEVSTEETTNEVEG